MTSIAPHIKVIPSENTYFINVGNMATAASAPGTGFAAPKVFQLVGGVANAATPSFSTATWACNGVTSSLLASAGQAVFRDLGRTIVSSYRTFRKVQLLVSSISNSVTIGAPVASQAGPQPWLNTPTLGEEYYTGYIELPGYYPAAMGGAGAGGFLPAPVARLG